MEGNCKNHPRKKTKRRCYQCRAFVCLDCQILASRHYFCSIRCYQKFLGPETEPGVPEVDFKFHSFPVHLWQAVFGKWKVIPWTVIFIGLMAIGLLGSLWLINDLRMRLNELQGRLTSTTEQGSDGALTVTNPVNGGMVLSNRFEITGEADDNHIISLSVDDQVKAVTLPRNGQFSFENVAAKRGDNNFTVRMMDEDGTVTTLQSIKIVYNNPTLRYLSKSVRRGNPDARRIALTFDGGWMANAAAEILDILKEKGLRSTIFLTGTFIEKYPELVKRIVAEGHEVGNHTWSHSHLTTFAENAMHLTRPEITREVLQEELQKTAAAFTACTGKKMAPYWRAPFGEHNEEIREWAAEVGYRHVGWTLGRDWESSMDTMDWVADTTSPAYRTADEILEKILDFGNGSAHEANGCIILMHLGTLRNSDLPHKKLPQIIDGLQKQGYGLVTVSELLD